MEVTFEQASAFDAVVKFGTVQKAAQSVNKGHSAVLYLIRSLEEQTQVQLFDRSGYRNKITLEGEIVLKYCREMLGVREHLREVCKKLVGGWEPSLKLIYDGVIDFNLIGSALKDLSDFETPTEVKVLSAYLADVEQRFEEEDADMMVTILPIKRADLSSVKLPGFKMLLVAHREHKLTQIKGRSVQLKDLKNHTFIKIKAGTNPLRLSTDQMEFTSSFMVNDFYTKKQAITKGLGYGWLPEYLIQHELKTKQLKILSTEILNSQDLRPRLYHRKEELVGKTAEHLIKYFRKSSSAATNFF